jgi:long-chain acyl-CoA synthetase
VDKLWLKHYQKGVPYEIDTNRYTSLAQLFDETCQKYKHHIAYVNMGTEMSYKETAQVSSHFATYLQHLRLKKGARVAIMMPNILQYPMVLFAVLRAGYIVVNTNPLYTTDEVVHQLKDAGAEAIVVLANFAKTIEQALPQLPLLQHVVITEIGDLFPTVKRMVVNAVVKYIKKMVPNYSIPKAVSFIHALKKGAKHEFQPTILTHQDIAFLQYTGGTTGISKGAILTHGNMVANVMQASAWISPLSLDGQDIIVTALPLYHIFSLTANCLTFFSFGAKNILITNPRDLSAFIHEIKNSQFTAITGVNTLFNALLNHPKCHEIDFSKLKLALSGGMALQKSIAFKWRQATNSRVLEAYGLTETSPAVCINPMYLEEYNGSIGLPLSSTDISIRDNDGKELPLGQTGELCVKGPQVTPGYWRHPDETERAFWGDGFLRTGDIATVNDEGYVFLVDRQKDMIIVSGFNVYPNEVEQVISMMPGVLEVGVIGVVKDELGEQVKACIVKRDPSLTAEAVIEHSREHLTGYKVPKLVEFYEELPKTNVGKILRRALK